MWIVTYTTKAGSRGERIFMDKYAALDYHAIRNSKGHPATILKVNASKLFDFFMENGFLEDRID